MRHQDWHGHGGKNAARHAAENELTQAGMAVTAHHHEIRPAIGGIGQQDIFDPNVALGHALDAGGAPCRARCALMFAPVISSLLRSSATITMSTAFARSRKGMASPIARAAVRLPSQHASTRSSVSPRLWM